jgi:hypothetical protein
VGACLWGLRCRLGSVLLLRVAPGQLLRCSLPHNLQPPAALVPVMPPAVQPDHHTAEYGAPYSGGDNIFVRLDPGAQVAV